jgi:hypothetical protein
MTVVTLDVPRARRPARRQAALACASGAYLTAVAAALLGVVALFAGTAVAALAATGMALTLGLVAGALCALDAALARRHPVAPVIALPARHRRAIAG